MYLDQQHIDTTTRSGKLVFQITGAFAESKRSIIQQRVHAWLARARAQGKRLGRPEIDSKIEWAICQTFATGQGLLKTAAQFGIGSGTVQRIRAEMQRPPYYESGLHASTSKRPSQKPR